MIEEPRRLGAARTQCEHGPAAAQHGQTYSRPLECPSGFALGRHEDHVGLGEGRPLHSIFKKRFGRVPEYARMARFPTRARWHTF